jgi:hypothetical protein
MLVSRGVMENLPRAPVRPGVSMPSPRKGNFAGSQTLPQTQRLARGQPSSADHHTLRDSVRAVSARGSFPPRLSPTPSRSGESAYEERGRTDQPSRIPRTASPAPSPASSVSASAPPTLAPDELRVPRPERRGTLAFAGEATAKRRRLRRSLVVQRERPALEFAALACAREGSERMLCAERGAGRSAHHLGARPRARAGQGSTRLLRWVP